MLLLDVVDIKLNAIQDSKAIFIVIRLFAWLVLMILFST